MSLHFHVVVCIAMEHFIILILLHNWCIQVKDTVEVDHNVTRHLKKELAATDWDLLVRVFSARSN